jgi:hypothetical protein
VQTSQSRHSTSKRAFTMARLTAGLSNNAQLGLFGGLYWRRH